VVCRSLESLGLQWVFKGVKKKHKTLGEALTFDEWFMTDYINREAKYYASNVHTDEAINEVWMHHCAWTINRAQYETEKDWIEGYTSYAKNADEDDIIEWARKRISEDAPEYWMQIKENCAESNDGLRQDHPIIGCYQRARDEIILLEDIRGWCPFCGEPLVHSDISWGRDILGSGADVEIFKCGNCGSADPIDGFETKFGRPFHLPINPKNMNLKETPDGETIGIATPTDD
jgi:hypothetical protein